MNPLAIALAAVQAVPTAVAGIEYLHKEASSASKQQLALDALTVLTTGVNLADPALAPLATELNSVFGALIKLTVSTFNATGTFKHKAPVAPSPEPAPAAAPAKTE